MRRRTAGKQIELAANIFFTGNVWAKCYWETRAMPIRHVSYMIRGDSPSSDQVLDVARGLFGPEPQIGAWRAVIMNNVRFVAATRLCPPKPLKSPGKSCVRMAKSLSQRFAI